MMNIVWVCDDSAYARLLAQGYVTAYREKRHGKWWRGMVLPS